MSKERFERGILLGTFLLCAIPASAQLADNCAPRETVISRLAAGFGEARQSAALSSSGALVENYASPETGTWTITVTTADGITCLAASGHNFEKIDESLNDGDPT